MTPISEVSTGAVQPLIMAEKVPEAPKAQISGEARNHQLKPVIDEYVRSEPQEPSGRYWIGKDENGQPKIYFDDPDRAADAPDAKASKENSGAKGPEGKRDKDEVWECNTDKVDREIEKLKKKRQELEQRLNTETDEAKIKDLERQLAQVERELKEKDTDTYRKQHSAFTQLS